MGPKSEALIFYNANVITLREDMPRAQGLRVEDGRITHVFDGAGPAELTGKRIDLEGATILPGIVDAHIHVRNLGASARRINLKGTPTAESVVQLVADAVKKVPPGSWVHGRGWDQNDWPVQEFPTAAMLDAVAPDHPVFLTRIDGHAVWVNSKAMEAAGLDAATTAPEGGFIHRDDAGKPTGVLIDNAIDLVSDKIPEPSREVRRLDFQHAFELLARAGITGAHDMGMDPTDLEILREMEKAGEVTARVSVYLHGNIDELTPLLSQAPDREGLVRVLGVKLFADGALGSRGAALLEPYSDKPETKGLMLTKPAELTEISKKVHAAGYQLAIHAIGDRGNRVALDSIEAAQGSDTSRRHRVEHAQVVNLADIERFKTLGAVASMQPVHATSDMPWADERLGPDRLAGAYAWRRFLDTGVVLAFGSDAPVEDENPWHGLYASVTRQDAEGSPKGGWLPDQKLTFEEALRGFTVGAAYSAHDENLGFIAPGAAADLTVVPGKPETMEPSALRELQALRTIVGGRQAYAAD